MFQPGVRERIEAWESSFFAPLSRQVRARTDDQHVRLHRWDRSGHIIYLDVHTTATASHGAVDGPHSVRPVAAFSNLETFEPIPTDLEVACAVEAATATLEPYHGAYEG